MKYTRDQMVKKATRQLLREDVNYLSSSSDICFMGVVQTHPLYTGTAG
jgi:hypothetical protein